MLERLSEHLALLQYAHVLWGFVLFVALAVWVCLPSRQTALRHQAERILRDDHHGE